MGEKQKPSKPDVTSFIFSTKSTRGYTSKMTGNMRSPEQMGVVTAALCGQLADNADALRAMPDLLEALQRIVNPAPGVSQKAPAWVYGIARAALTKASPNLPSDSQEGAA